MKIGIVSLATKEIEDMSIAILNKQAYCKKHNYTFINYKERLSKRHCPWDKIQCLLKTIHWFDYIVWIDADAVFQNHSITFESIIQEYPDKDLLICKDPCFWAGDHCMINTGVIIMKNTFTSIQLLNDTWYSCNDYNVEKLDKYSYAGYPHEQGAMVNMLKTERYKNCYYLYEQSKFNTHPNFLEKDTFIVHFMGSRQSESHKEDFIKEVRKINEWVDETKLYYTPTKRHKIAIVTMYTENIKSYSQPTTANKEEYAKKHNMDLIVTKKRLSSRHPAWDKIKCVENAMKRDYDYVIWMDADSIFVNDSIDFNSILNFYPDKNFMVCLDPTTNKEMLDTSLDYNELSNLRIINTGIFIMKNNKEMKELISSVWNTKSNTNIGLFNPNKVVTNFNYDDWPYEQGAFHLVFRGRKDIEIFPDKSFNTVPNKAHQHSFIVHNMGSHEDMISLVQKYKDKKIPVIDKKIPVIDKDKITVIDKEVPFDLSGTFNVKLHIEINKLPHIILIVFQWKLPKDKHLSHVFKINGTDYHFNSDPEGIIQLPFTEELTIKHSYDFFGTFKWVDIL